MPATLYTITFEPVPYYLPAGGENPAYKTHYDALKLVKRQLSVGLIDSALRTAEQNGLHVAESAPLFVDAVLTTQEREARMSDYSDYYWTYNIWTGTEVKEVGELHPVPEAERYLPGHDYCVVWTLDKDAETTGTYAGQIAAWRAEQARVAALWTQARKWAGCVADGVENLRGIARDRDCTVARGKKAPKGRGYRVKWLGDGQYGPYANLLAPDGKEYKFVSLSNLEREVAEWETDHYTRAFTETFKDPQCVAIAREILTGNKGAWLVLCDRVQELHGDEFGEIFRQQVGRVS